MSKDWQSDIMEFHIVAKHYIQTIPKLAPDNVHHLRRELILEEMSETVDALDKGDLVGIADGITDSIVVLLGTAVSYGIDIQPIWDEVHKTNMAKIDTPKRADGKSMKPEGWEPPRIELLLMQQGMYDTQRNS